tara:strand:+ start:18618 stop:27962 length:9345 start_codon:yes stop_codon:yes gene_type:complete
MKTALLIVTAIFSSLSFSLNAANRYWVSNVSSNWNNTANWSTSSGGASGATVPTTGDFVYFNASGTGDCTFDIPVAIDGIRTTGYTGQIDLAGFAFNATVSNTASCTFENGTIKDASGTSEVNFNTSGLILFSGTTFNTPITGVAGRIQFNGGTFNNPVIVEDNGGSSTNGNGGCTFNSTLKVTNSGSSYFLMGYTYPDVFNGDVTLINTSTSRIRMAYRSAANALNANVYVASTAGSGIWFGENGGTTSLAATKTIQLDVAGFSAGELRFKNFTQTGATTQNLTLTGTAYLRAQTGTTFNGDVTFTAPRIEITGTNFAGTTTIEKTGSGNDYSSGGNTFTGNAFFTNSGSGYLVLGSGGFDSFLANLTVNNNGTSNIYVANNVAGNTIGGDLTVNNNATGTNTYVYLANQSASTLTVDGNAVFNNSPSSSNGTIYIGEYGDITFNGTVAITNAATGLNGHVLLANQTNSSVTIAGATTVSNTGSGTTKRVYLGGSGDVSFNSTLDIANASSANNSEVFLNYNANSLNTYADNVTISSSNALTDGIRFGQNGGAGTLAAGKTITIGAGGFVAGQLQFRNFTQTGATPHSFTLTGTSDFYNYDSNWGGNVSVVAPRINTRGTTYSGTTYLEKNGASDDASVGGNHFVGNTELKNSGSRYFLMGNGVADAFDANLTINNTGSHYMYLAHNSAGNTVSGDLTVTNAASAANSYVYISNATASTLNVGGNVVLNNTPSGTNGHLNFGDYGDVTVGGNLTVNNNPTTTSSQIIVGNNTTSTINVGGNTIVTNNGGSTTKRVYLGNNGDITFNGTVAITNNSTATNSEIYCNHTSNSLNTYNGDITIASNAVSGDGIRFGEGGGAATLAATKTVTIPGVDALNFVGGQVTFRNFTQVGATPQSLELGSTATYIYNYNSNWGGNVQFISPRVSTRGTTYNGTALIQKTGTGNDASVGGNHFVGNTELKNTGANYILMGNGTADTFDGDLTLTNLGASHIYLAYNSAGNTVGGNLLANNTSTGNGSTISISGNSASTLTVTGTATFNNNATGTNGAINIGDNGDITFNSSLALTNNASGAYGQIILASNSNSAVTIAGNTTVTNTGAGSTKRVYLGNNGDVTFNGSLTIVNSATASNSEIYCNNSANSVNAYNGDILVSSTSASSDGIRFGQYGGQGTLAATKTITIPGVDATNYIGGELRFQNFTQLGNTAHSFELGATATYFYNYSSNWGGNVNFTAPRIITNRTIYNGTAYLEKTGTGNDASIGGNTFKGNTELKNSGTQYLLMGNGYADSFLGNLTLTNTGSYNMYLGYNSAGNTISGDLTVNNNATGSSPTIYLCNYAASTLAVSGNTSITNATTGSNGNIYIGENGDITFNGNLVLTNNATGTNGQILLAQNSNSAVSIAGNTSVLNQGANTTKRIYLGNQGDVTFNGTLDIVNNASAINAEVFCNNGTYSTNFYNQNITVSSTHASSDGIRFGQSGGQGTLAATKTITIPGVDAANFIGGQLRFQNFTQVGNTPHSFELGATANYLYNQNSSWGGNTSWIAPRILMRSTTFAGTTHLEKTGAGNDYSYGGNTFGGNTEMILNNNVGTGTIYFSNNAASSIGGSLLLENKGSFSDLLYGNLAGAYPINGDLTVINSTTGTGNQTVYLGNNAASAFTVTGNFNVTNSATGTSGTHNIVIGNNGSLSVSGNATANNTGANGTYKRIYLGNRGDFFVTGNLAITNSTTANTGEVIMANYAESTASVGGNTTLSNNGTGAYKRCYLGNYGDVTFNGNLDMVNNSSATSSEIYLNDQTGSVNTYNGNITVKTTHTSNDGIRFGNNGGAGTLAATKTITIPGVDVTNFIGGDLLFRNFTQTGATSQSLELAATANYIYNRDCNWGGNITFKAPRIYTKSTTYNGTTLLEKTGGSDDNLPGGNTFVGNTTIINSGNRYLLFGNGTADVFQGNLDLQNNGSHHLYIAYRGAGHSISGNLTSTNSATGTGDYRIYIAEGSNSTLSIGGNTTLNHNGSGKTLRTYFGNSGDITIGGTLTANNSGTGTTSQIYLANGTASSLTVAGTSTMTNNNTASNSNRIYVGYYGDITFNGALNLVNNAGTNESEIYCNYGSPSNVAYNQNITVATYSITSDGILFGAGGGYGTLASGKTISIPGVDAANYTGGQLYFRNFAQLGATAQTLELGANASYFQSYSSTWNGALTVKGPRFYTRSSTFNGNVSLTKTGGLDDNMYGANIFAGTASYTNQGAGRWRIAYNVGNDYNGNTTFNQSSTGTLDPAYNTSSTFAGDITVNSGSIIRFGRAGGGRVILDGTTAQSINTVAATPGPEFRDLQTINASNEITLNTPITILTDLDLDQGNLISTSTNMIYVNDNAIASSASNNAYVDGPITKIGNDAFAFPVGDAGFYAPITMSAPNSGSARFEAEYFHKSPHTDGYDSTAISSGIDHVSDTEYWHLNRIASSSTVYATLGWNNTRSGSIGSGTICDTRVTRWNGTKWLNDGNGGATGNTTAGTVTTGTSENCATPTKITTWVNDYPLTLATDSNYITWDGTAYDGGSGTAGAPSTADAGRILKVFAPGAVASIDADLDKIIVTPTGRLTINSGIAVIVSGLIDNKGEIIIENNGSLIQTSVGSDENTGSGDYIVKRQGNSNTVSYNIWSSPLKSAAVTSVFTGSNPCDMWVFDGTSQGWSHDFTAGYSATCNGNSVTFSAADVIAGGDGIMDKGRGYFVPGATISLKQFQGTVNNGDITIPITSTTLGNQPFWNDDDWNLVGNPYPSGLNAAAFWTENAVNNNRITDAIYYWDDNGAGSGYNQNADYASWNALGGVNSGNSATIPNGNVASGQGFWVVAANTSNLVFNNSMRSATNNQFFKQRAVTDKHLAWVSLATPSGFQNNLLVGYADDATDGIDPLYDAHKLAGSSHVRFASLINDQEFAIQGFANIAVGTEKVVPLVLFTDTTGIHTIAKYKTENLPANMIIYVRDLETGTVHNLSTGDYQVYLLGNQEYKNRFELIFEHNISKDNGGNGTKGGTGNGDTATTVTGIDDSFIQDQFRLATTPNGYVLSRNEGITGDIVIVDVTGKVIWSKTNINNDLQIMIDLSHVSAGMYILELRNDNERIYQNKIMKR